jgi:two-component system invasion response regulator UvrY
MTTNKNILLADAHSIIRLGIKSIIRENLQVNNIDEAADETAITEKIKQKQYDLLLLDTQIPHTDFNKLISWITIVSPLTDIIVFTMQPEEVYGIRCLQLGTKGFLKKEASNEEILFAIKKVLNGERYMSARLSDMLANYISRKSTGNPFDNLSQREMEMVLHLQKGKTLPEICDILKIQYSTANTYKRRIFEKLQVTSLISLSRMMEVYKN